jgi:hypothetical protein
MKALFCLLPWIATLLAYLLGHPVEIVALVWLAISPAVTVLGLMVAYIEGRRSA